jgi:four helix bundle protein
LKTELEARTKTFALKIMKYVACLPKNKVADAVGYQLVRSGTSIGANYRESQRAESKADFIHKVAIGEKESSETCYWLELCIEGKIGDKAEAESLLAEAKEILAILVATGRTAKRNSSLK